MWAEEGFGPLATDAGFDQFPWPDPDRVDLDQYRDVPLRDIAPGGGYACGSSNSVTYYVPLATSTPCARPWWRSAPTQSASETNGPAGRRSGAHCVTTGACGAPVGIVMIVPAPKRTLRSGQVSAPNCRSPSGAQ